MECTQAGWQAVGGIQSKFVKTPTQVSNSKENIKRLIEKYEKMETTEMLAWCDKNVATWGLHPGTQIFYKGAFGSQLLQHHGVYVGDGLVFEVGGKWCRSGPSKFTDQCLSVSSLGDFVSRGKGVIYAVHYESPKYNPLLSENSRQRVLTTKRLL